VSSQISVSDLKLTIFNATVKNEGRNMDLMADVVSKIKLPFVKKKYSNGYSVEVVEVKARYGRFQTAFEISDEYSFKSINRQVNINALEFKVRLSKGKRVQGASFTLYDTGSIRFSGGYIDVGIKKGTNAVPIEILEQPETIRQHIVNTYTHKQAFLKSPLVFNNIGAIFKVNKPVLLAQTAGSNQFQKTAAYEPEISPRMTIRVGGFILQVSAAGVVQMKGVKDPENLGKAYTAAVDAARQFKFKKSVIKNFNKLNFRNAPIAKRANALPAPNVSRRGTTCPVARRPDPYSFQGKCPDMKKKGKMVACYVKPNPQGQPCCYAKPKTTAFTKNKVAAAYNKANVKVPNSVRQKFLIGGNTNNKKNNVGQNNFTAENITVSIDPVVGLKIGSRQASRYTRVGLYDIAKRLGIVDITPKMTKLVLAERIQEKATNRTREVHGNLAVRFNLNQKEYSITGTGKNMRIGARVASTYDKKNLVKFADRLRIPLGDKVSKAELCRLINSHATAKRANRRANANAANAARQAGRNRRARNAEAKLVENKAKKVKNAANLAAEKLESFEERLGITEGSIKRDLPKLFGKKFMRLYGTQISKDFDQMAKLMIQLLKIKKFKTGARQKPLKPDVDAAKSNIVEQWKITIEPSLVKMALFKNEASARKEVRNLVGPNATVTNRMVNSYVKSMRNAAATRNRKTGKFADAAALKKARNVWLYAEKKYGNLKKVSPLRNRQRRVSPSNFTEEI
jgi:hypothetical protein